MTAHYSFPLIHELGDDLLDVSAWQRLVVIARPFLACSLYWIFASRGWWWAALGSLAAMMFLTYVSSSHDYVHRTLGLPGFLNECLLTITELLGLRSGHAFRLVHLNHHRKFPGPDDVEAFAASQGFWRALLAGPTHQLHIMVWAWRHASVVERRFLWIEAGAIGCLLGGTLLHRTMAIYAIAVIAGSWFYPLFTVWLPHRRDGATPLEHTRAVRGSVIPILALQHTYHLEHHLYPMVPSVNWRKLAERLSPYLDRAGVRPIYLP
jgi:beta-carotene hydroxylase